ncbi:hypothetical protein ACXOUX_08615 [Streptococcus thermophilus]
MAIYCSDECYTLSFTEGIAFIDHSLVWATLSLAVSLFALRLASEEER